MFFSRLVVLLCALNLIDQISTGNAAFAASSIEAKEVQLQVPSWSKEIELALSLDLRTKINEAAAEVIGYLDRLIDEMLTKGITPGRWIEIGKEVKELADRAPKQAVEFARKFGYDKYIKAFCKGLMTNAHVIEKTLNKDTAKTKEWLNTEIHKALFAVQKTIQSSQASVYLAWNAGLVNGKPAEEYYNGLAGRLSYHGYSHLLSIAHTALRAILMYDKLKSKLWGSH